MKRTIPRLILSKQTLGHLDLQRAYGGDAPVLVVTSAPLLCTGDLPDLKAERVQ